MLTRLLLKHLARLVVTVLAAGLVASIFVRLAPAFGVSETELDPRFGRPAQLERAAEPNGFVYYIHFVGGLLRGDLGDSPSFQRPIAELVRERLPTSLRTLAVGTAAGVFAGLGTAIVAVTVYAPGFEVVPVAASTVLLSIPSAALALLFLVVGWPPWVSLAAVVFPRAYRHASAVLVRCAAAPHVTAAKARGLSSLRILIAHIAPLAAPQLLAITGMAVSIAFPALVPIEVVSDSPGLLQLALKAAFARDLPLLVMLTMIASVVLLIGNAAADLSAEAARRDA